MLKVGNLTQNQSNSIFLDSSSIKMTPVISAEWNQNIFNPPYITIAGDAVKQTSGTPTGATVSSVTDPLLVKKNFTTKSVTTSGGSASIVYPITTSSTTACKIVFFAKTNKSTPTILNTSVDSNGIAGSSSIEINSFGWTKIETYVGSQTAFTSFNYRISASKMSQDVGEHIIYFTIPEVYLTTFFDYQYNSIYPTDDLFSHFRPGESYVNTGNNAFSFPANYRRIKSQVLSSETLSGGYYGNKYMPVSPIVSNPTSSLATIPFPVYKQVLPSSLNQYKYFVSDTSESRVSAIYESSIYANKIVIKTNNIISTDSFNIYIDGSILTVDGSTTVTVGQSDVTNSGLIILYWTGSAWTKTKWSSSAMPKFNDSGVLSKYTTLSKITINGISKTNNNSTMSTYAGRSTYLSDDIDRYQIIEISPRLEIDLTDFVQDFSINKSLDSQNSVVPISSIDSNDAQITLSNIPINKANLLVPVFSSQSNIDGAMLVNMLRKNVKFYTNFYLESYSNSVENSFTTSNTLIPGGVFYTDSWQENDIDTVNIQLFDITRFLQSTPVPDYVARLKNVFDIITNILDYSGFTDYDYDSLFEICNDIAAPLDLAYYYCNSKDSTIIGALSEIFLAYQIGAYIDEYGIMKFLSLSKILSSSTSNISIADSNIVKGGYSISNEAKPGKISIRYQPPKIKQSPALQNATDPAYRNSMSFLYTTSNDVLWTQQGIDSIGYNYLSSDFLKTESKFRMNIPSKYDIFHTYNLDANNLAIIEEEVVSFLYKDFNISKKDGSNQITVSVKSSIELEAEINKYIKKYSAQLITYDPEAPITYDPSTTTSYDIKVTPTGYISNVQRGLFGTKVKDHKLLSTLADKELSQASCSSSYSITTGTSTASADSLYRIKVVPTQNTKTLVYPTSDIDTNYKTFLTKINFNDSSPVSSGGLFFNLSSTSSTENAYFLELTRYAPNDVDENGNYDYRYILALYRISSGIEKIKAWADVTSTVSAILETKIPKVFTPVGDTYKIAIDESFVLKLTHYPSTGYIGEDTGELVEIFLNNVEITNWQVPINEDEAPTSANIIDVQEGGIAGENIEYTTSGANPFTVGQVVSITGINPSKYNSAGTVVAAGASSFELTEPTYDPLKEYIGGGIAKLATSDELYTGYKTIAMNEQTKFFKKICLAANTLNSNSKYGSFISTASIAKTKSLATEYVPASTTSEAGYILEIYACEMPLKERSANYHFQDKTFLNAMIEGYNLNTIKTFMMQTKPVVNGLNYYDVQYPNPAAVSADVLPIEYLWQYYPSATPADREYLQQIIVDVNALSYSTPINTGFRAKMAITNNTPGLVFLSKDPDDQNDIDVKLNLWTHEIIAPSDEEVAELVIDKFNISETVQIDSEWIQSKESAYKLLNLMQKSIDGFSKTVDLEIFGNPLLQVGDIVTLTYSYLGINLQQYIIKTISHSFQNGLTTKISMNMLNSGTQYSMQNIGTTIEITPSISSLAFSSTQQFTATAYDQYGIALDPQPSFTWSTNNGTISSLGLYTATIPSSNIEVYATANQIFGSTEFIIGSASGQGDTYTVTFNEQGGSAVTDTTYTQGQSFALPSAPTRSGYSFSGWYLASTGGTALISPYTPPSPYGNITVYAQWTAAGGVTAQSATYGTGGRTGMTAQILSSGNDDDGYYAVNLPYSITFNGQSYSTIYVGTNSYVTFGGASTNYSGLSSFNPALDKIMIASQDATVSDGGTDGGLWFESSASYWRIRYQGRSLSGQPNAPTIIWELSSQSTTSNILNLQIGATNGAGVTNISSSTGTVWSNLGSDGTGWNLIS